MVSSHHVFRKNYTPYCTLSRYALCPSHLTFVDTIILIMCGEDTNYTSSHNAVLPGSPTLMYISRPYEMTLYSFVDTLKNFGGRCCLYLQGTLIHFRQWLQVSPPRKHLSTNYTASHFKRPNLSIHLQRVFLRYCDAQTHATENGNIEINFNEWPCTSAAFREVASGMIIQY